MAETYARLVDHDDVVDDGTTLDRPTLLESHALWLAQLREHVYGGRPLDPEAAGRDDECELAQWLEQTEPQLSDTADYWHLVAVHARFHKRSARVVRLANLGRRIEAELELAPGSELRCLSADLVQTVSRLERMTGRPCTADTAAHYSLGVRRLR